MKRWYSAESGKTESRSQQSWEKAGDVLRSTYRYSEVMPSFGENHAKKLITDGIFCKNYSVKTFWSERSF